MTSIDLALFDLSSPEGRKALLDQIPPTREAARKYHRQLLDLLVREMDFRKLDGDPSQGGESNSFEQLYQCALLLYLAGDSTDAPLIWRAKHTNMDTACGLDAQFLVGAGVDETIAYCETNNEPEIAAYITGNREGGIFDEIDEWLKGKVRYHYGGLDELHTAR